jgi:hypothetical protein
VLFSILLNDYSKYFEKTIDHNKLGIGAEIAVVSEDGAASG